MSPVSSIFYKLGAGIGELVVTQGARFTFPEHTHVSSVTAGFVRRGRIVVTRAGRSEIRAAGDVYILPPYEPHCVCYTGECAVVCLCLDAPCLYAPDGDSTVMAVLRRARAHLSPERISGQELDALEKVFHEMRLSGDGAGTHARRDAPTAAKMLERHPEMPAPLRDLAEEISTGVPYYIRMFKKRVGLTPHRFQVQNRVRYAKGLLETPLAVAEVALIAGFYDQSHLNRCFRKAVGMTPGQYRVAVRRFP